MSKDFCLDCGMLLSPNTSICYVCGFDNAIDDDFDIPQVPVDLLEDDKYSFLPDNAKNVRAAQ